MNKELILEKFKNFLLKKELSKSSIQSYALGLSSFLSFLYKNNVSYLSFNNDDIENYALKLTGSNQSINSKLFSIKKYCEYLNENNLNEIYFKAKFKKIKKKDINLISQKYFDEIIDFIDNNSKNDLIKLRDVLIFKFLYYLGIRVSDLVKIKIEDVKIDEYSLLVNNKNIILEKDLFIDLLKYIEKIPDSSFLFFSFASNRFNFNKGLTVKSIEDIFNKYIKIIGNDYTINDLRNSYLSDNKVYVPIIDKIYSHKIISYHDDFISFIQ